MQDKSDFSFEGMTQNGKTMHGRYSGTFKDFEKYLKTQHLTLINYKEKKKKLRTGKFKDSDFSSIVEELYYLINSGVKVDDSLKLLMKSSSKEKTFEFLTKTLDEIKKGNQLSEAVKNSSKSVEYKMSPLYISILSSGEEIGNVSYSLKTLKEFIDFKEEIVSEVRQALAYPLFLIGMSVMMVFFVFLVVVPKFTEIFTPDELEKIPFISQLVLKSGLYVNENLSAILLITLVIISSIILFFKYSKTNIVGHLFNIPFFKNLIIELELSRAFNSMGMMMKGGLEIDKVLRHSLSLFSVDDLKSIFQEALMEIKKGRKLSEVFASSSLIPPQAISMVTVGENSATMDHIFISLAQRFLRNFKIKTKKILSLLEPVIVVFMGMFIAVIVVSIMLAVISINDIAM